MANSPESGARSAADVRAQLDDVARMLRESRSMDPQVRHAFTKLLDELTAALATTNAPPAEVARLAESAAHLADAVHRQHDRGLLEKARDRLESAMIEAEVHAPIAVGLARGLIDALANMGI